MIKKYILLIIVFFVVNLVFAGDGNNKFSDNSKYIYGKVIDKKSGEEIAGAIVKINGKIIYTDLNGNFSASVSKKQNEVIVTSVSYNETKVNINPYSYNTIIVELDSK